MRFADVIAIEPLIRNLNPLSYLNPLTLGDVAGVAWNSLVALPVALAGIWTAVAVTRIAHTLIRLVTRRKVSKPLSGVTSIGAFIVGSNISYMVAARMNLVAFSADKVFRLAILVIPLPGVALSVYGTRALCVLGSLSAMSGAVTAHQELVKRQKPVNQPRFDSW